MADDNINDVVNNDERQSTGATRAAGKAKDKASEQAKKALKKAKEAQKKGKYAKGLGKIFFYLAAIIIIIIMVIGFIAFAINMPGLIVDKITATMTEAAVGMKQWWTEQDLSVQSAENIKQKKIELLNYLDSMGYEVVGMGFVAGRNTGSDSDTTPYLEDITKMDPNNTTEVVQPSYLFSYYIANERIFVPTHIRFIDKILKTSSATNTWGEGMLNIYGDLGALDAYTVDRENLTLTFNNVNGLLKTDTYQYNIDGWSGRYGSPLELLLTLHSATMMPDLVYEFVSNPNLQTLVNIDTSEVKLEVTFKLRHLLESGGSEEVDINLGNADDEPFEIVFKKGSNGDYYVENIEQIKQDIQEGKYSIISFWKTFNNFETSFNDYFMVNGESGTRQDISEIFNSSTDYMYCIKEESDPLNAYVDGKYLGTTESVVVGTKFGNEYTGIATVTNIDEVHKTITYTNAQGQSAQAAIAKVCSPDKFFEKIMSGEQVVDGTMNFKEHPNDAGTWIENEVNYYTYIFREVVDAYFQNFIDGNYAGGELHYSFDNSYSWRYSEWKNSWEVPYTQEEFIETQEYRDLKAELVAEISRKSGGHVSTVADSTVYDEYLKNFAKELYNNGDNEFTRIINDIKEDIEVQVNTANKAEQLKRDLAAEIGLTPEQINEIYEKFVEQPTTIQTFVPTITSVVKHWYKDLAFVYNNKPQGSVFATSPSDSAEAGVPGYELYYEFKTVSDNYPVQDGEPYVIKGDVITKDGKVVEDINSININPENEQKLIESIGDYELGSGYKTARKLFTQGYYYQYDGSTSTANEIVNAKRMEAYDPGTLLRVQTTNGKLTYVQQFTSDMEIEGGTDSQNGQPYSVMERPNGSIVRYYKIRAPEKYVSPATGTYEETVASVKSINNALKSVGSDLRRKKVNITNNTTTLNALSMLEGMHSLDADYIYREFKEFLIELGYYSRTELEAVETNILDWFIPGFTPEQWPPIKNEETMLEYGTTLLAEGNINQLETVTIDKMTTLDNFIFITDSDVLNQGALNTKGQNISYINGINVNSIVDTIKNKKPTAICLYVGDGFTTNNADEKIAKTEEDILNIRKKLEEDGYEQYDLPIYLLQTLPAKGASIIQEASVEAVAKNEQISYFNKAMYSWCIGQENTKFIDATTGCVNDQGYLNSSFDKEKFSNNIADKIIIKNVTNGGFKEGLDVITPGAGYITSISDTEITIEFSVEQDHALRSIDGFSIIISGIAVKPDLISAFNASTSTDSNGSKVLPIGAGEVIGLTTTENIKLILRDKNKAIIGNIEDYMSLPKKATGTDLGQLEDIMNFILSFEGGLNSNAEGDNWIVIPDLNYPNDWHANTAGGSGITNWCENEFISTGHEDLWPMQIGDRVPISAILEVKAATVQNKFDALDTYLAQYGITNWGFDQKSAFVSLMYNGYSGSWGAILQAYASGNTRQFVKLWMDCGNLPGHFYRRAVELDLFFTGNYEVNELRKHECLDIYSNY